MSDLILCLLGDKAKRATSEDFLDDSAYMEVPQNLLSADQTINNNDMTNHDIADETIAVAQDGQEGIFPIREAGAKLEESGQKSTVEKHKQPTNQRD